MDFQFWLYIIIAVIYGLSRALKKKAPQTGPPDDYQAPNTPKQAPMSFEDLLREITESKTSTPQPVPEIKRPQPEVIRKVEAPKQTYIDYDDDLKDEIEDLEDVNYDYRNQDKVYEVYESAKKEAFARPSLEESSNLRSLDEQVGRFKEFEIGKKRTDLNKYVKELRDKDGFKKAFILSEILNKKY